MLQNESTVQDGATSNLYRCIVDIFRMGLLQVEMINIQLSALEQYSA
jgi:hypothetical protein